MIRVALVGASGRMGSAIRDQADALTDLQVTLAFVSERSTLNLPQVRHQPSELKDVDVVVDISNPATCIEYAQASARLGIPFVSGTTGLDAESLAALTVCAQKIPVLHTANFSVGINILEHLVELAARAAAGFDVEIFEAHHRRKVDAPSGTALLLGNAAARGREVRLDDVAVFDRHGVTGARTDGEIGFQVMRGGGIVGEHTVFLASEGERIELTHRAHDRGVFAQGALRAAYWIAAKPPGTYTMRDVLFG
jgi:4-hydroxy-tetrahydrodipicolinate reductase